MIKNTHIYLSWFYLYQKHFNLTDTMVYPKSFKGTIDSVIYLDACFFSMPKLKRNFHLILIKDKKSISLAYGFKRKLKFYIKDSIKIRNIKTLHLSINELSKKYSQY